MINDLHLLEKQVPTYYSALKCEEASPNTATSNTLRNGLANQDAALSLTLMLYDNYVYGAL